MNSLSVEVLNVLLFLTPGLFGTIVLDAVLIRKDKDAAHRIIEGLVLSLIIYGIISFFEQKFPVSIRVTRDPTGKLVDTTIDLDSTILLPILVFSIALPLLLGHLFTSGWFMQFLRRLRVTGRTGRESTWVDVFLDQKRYVIVNLSDGRRLFGWPLYYSDNREEGMLYLSDAAWYDENGEPREIENHGIFLVKKDNIDLIEFTHLGRQLPSQ